jgi:ABC-2 type transport system permease protein
VLLYTAGSTLGVRLSAGHWLHMTGFILIGLIPFAVLAILLGHLLTVDSIGPSIGGITALFSILGGVWFPITNGVMRDLAQALPSYWLVQAAHVGLGGNGWGARGWLVDGLWTAALAALAVRAYRRDTGRA